MVVVSRVLGSMGTQAGWGVRRRAMEGSHTVGTWLLPVVGREWLLTQEVVQAGPVPAQGIVRRHEPVEGNRDSQEVGDMSSSFQMLRRGQDGRPC